MPKWHPSLGLQSAKRSGKTGSRRAEIGCEIGKLGGHENRRSLQIFLRFTQATGHEQPHLRAVLANHRGLLAAMGRDPDEISRRLSEIARPLGIAPERFARPGS